MYRKISHRLHFAWGQSIGTPNGLRTILTTRKKIQMVQSDWRGRSSTRKIEEEASQKNEANEACRGAHKAK